MGKTYHALHALRGLAAVAVLLFHAQAVLGVSLAPSGYLAVDLFFILSGFVIAHAYEPRFERGLPANTFIAARAKRFWPLFVLGNAIGAGWLILENIVSPPASLTIPATLASGAMALFYLPHFTTGDLFPLNVPAWSLLFELIVNAGFAVFFTASRTRWLPAVVGISGLVLAILAATGLFEIQALGAFRAIYGFGMGVLLYRSPWRAPSLPAWAVIAGVCATFALPSSAPLQLACVFVLYPLAIKILAGDEQEAAGGAFKLLGDLSFPLYALHYPILQAALGLRNHLPVPGWVVGVAAVCACLAAAWLAEVLVDRPIRSGKGIRGRAGAG